MKTDASPYYPSLLARYAEACLWFQSAPAGTPQQRARLADANVLWNQVAEATILRELRAGSAK